MADFDGLNLQSRRALASLRLEGMQPTPEALADMKAVDAGLISMQECLQRALKRAGVVIDTPQSSKF